MSALEFLGYHLNQIRYYANWFDQFWWVMTLFFRCFPIISLGERAYFDEQASFHCDTLQPGCNQVCFNLFSPISYIRFWGYMVCFSVLPGIAYHAYTVIVANKLWKIKHLRIDMEEEKNSLLKEIKKQDLQRRIEKLDIQYKAVADRGELDAFSGDFNLVLLETTPGMRCWYLVHLYARILVEVLFLTLSYWLSYQQTFIPFSFKTFTVPEVYYCGLNKKSIGYEVACGQSTEAVTCWSSRPYEKTWFLWYQLFFQFVSLIVTIGEILLLFYKDTQRHTKYYYDKSCNRKIEVSKKLLKRYRKEFEKNSELVRMNSSSISGGNIDINDSTEKLVKNEKISSSNESASSIIDLAFKKSIKLYPTLTTESYAPSTVSSGKSYKKMQIY